MTPAELTGVEANLARRILSLARTIAPCLDSLEGESKQSAIAILLGVAAEAKSRGDRFVKAQRIGSASIDYGPASSWFLDDDRKALRGLCGAVTTGGPVGSFPKPARVISNLWPEHRNWDWDWD